MTAQDPLSAYIVRLRAALAGMTIAEREDIAEEIRAHVHDRVAEPGIGVEETLARLGTPEDLAADYGRGALVRRARSTFSPLTILRAAYAWAMTGIHGVCAFLTALFGYTLGIGFLVVGLLKPVFPEDTGLWVGPGIFEFGFRPGNAPHAEEVLGEWFTQFALALGVLLLIGTTMLMRRLLPRFKHWRASAMHPRATAARVAH
jgi:uncharacterized membrane protein